MKGLLKGGEMTAEWLQKGGRRAVAETCSSSRYIR